MASEEQQEESKTISLKTLIDRKNNKVVSVETTKDFVDTLFSFLSLPLATIIRLLAPTKSESSPLLANISNLYQTVQNLDSNDVWNNPLCKQMLLQPKNPCESLCMKLFMNVDDIEPSSKFYVCDFCCKFTTFQNVHCTCGKPANRQPKHVDSEGDGNNQNGVFVREKGSMFLVSDDLKILPSSSVSYLQLLMELGHSDLTQLEEVTHNIGKQEMLNLLKYVLTSHEPLTNTILKSSSKNKDNPTNPSATAVNVLPCTSNGRKMNVKVVQSKSQQKMIFTEANGDFVDFIFSFLTVPLGSIVRLLGPNSFVGCVGNLYKSVENMDSSLCTDSRSVLLNPGIAPQFGCPNQPLNIPHVQHPTYYYGSSVFVKNGDIISKSQGFGRKQLIALDPRKGAVGFVKRATLYGVGDDLKVKLLSANSFLSYLKELSVSFDDLEVKVISIGEAEALRFLGAFFTSKFTLTSGFGDLLNVPKQK